MALHHKLCHTLGGSFNLPHAEMHTIVLPHSVAYNRSAAPEAMARIDRALGGADPAAGLYDLAERLGAPLALADIGMPADGLARAADLATQNPYFNPRAIDRDAILALLRSAHAGLRPTPAGG
jgi:maleylacetate reductase